MALGVQDLDAYTRGCDVCLVEWRAQRRGRRIRQGVQTATIRSQRTGNRRHTWILTRGRELPCDTKDRGGPAGAIGLSDSRRERLRRLKWEPAGSLSVMRPGPTCLSRSRCRRLEIISSDADRPRLIFAPVFGCRMTVSPTERHPRIARGADFEFIRRRCARLSHRTTRPTRKQAPEDRQHQC